MDASCFAVHRIFAVPGLATGTLIQINLTVDEPAHYDYLLERKQLLEQERIPNAYSETRLVQALGDG